MQKFPAITVEITATDTYYDKHAPVLSVVQTTVNMDKLFANCKSLKQIYPIKHNMRTIVDIDAVLRYASS